MTIVGSTFELGASTGLYDALLVLHVVCALVGFGAVAVSGVYGGLARNPANQPETDRFFASSLRAEWLIVPVPFFGLGALLADHRSGALSDFWVLGGVALWIVATALLVAVVRPAQSRIRGASRRPEEGRVLLWAGVLSDVLFVVALALMVTQPG